MGVIAITGSQGCGKTTTLNGLKERGHPAIERKTARSILDEWGVTLYQVNNDHDLTIKFQEEILSRKFQDESCYYQNHQLVFTERSYVDLFVYAVIALGKDNYFSDWLDEYYIKCLRYQQCYQQVFYLSTTQQPVIADGVRGNNGHYSRMVDTVMHTYAQRMMQHQRLEFINTTNIIERIETIECFSARSVIFDLT